MKAAGHRRDRVAARVDARRQLDRAAPADRRRPLGVGHERSRVGDQLGPVAAGRLGHALHRPARHQVLEPDPPGGLVREHVEVGLGERLAPALARGLRGEQHREVRRQRLEAADLDDLDAGCPGALVVGVDHPPREGDLAGQVDVVRAGGDAGLDHRLAVEGVGADEVEDDPRARGHRRQRGRVGDVGRDHLRRLDADLAEHALHLARVASGRGPPRPDLPRPPGEVGGDAAAGHAGGAEDDDGEVPVGHARTLLRLAPGLSDPRRRP